MKAAYVDDKDMKPCYIARKQVAEWKNLGYD